MFPHSELVFTVWLLVVFTIMMLLFNFSGLLSRLVFGVIITMTCLSIVPVTWLFVA